VDQLEAEILRSRAALRMEGPFPDVLAHRATLVQVLVNLVSNALKFAVPGSEPRVRVRAETEEHWVRLWVEDVGIGIAPEHQERIFGVFERLHGVESYPGTGMGLAIVKKGVQRMGGEVGLESGLGKGSRFWVRLQRAPDEDPAPATPS
jgi:signal transduction histidine kinase